MDTLELYTYLKDRKLRERTILNIILVYHGIRNAYWCDTEIKNIFMEYSEKYLLRYKNKMIKILDPLEKIGLKYKFTSELYDEGPLIYRSDSKHRKIIESKKIEDLFPTPLFGSILGYETPGIRNNDAGIDIRVLYYTERKDGYLNENSMNLYSFRFPLSKIEFVTKNILNKMKKMDVILKEINSSYQSSFFISYNS